MKTLAARTRTTFEALALVAVTACGGGDDNGVGGSQVATHAPMISNLRYEPTSALQASGGTIITSPDSAS